ncbi:MAG: hypothetical protein AB7S81_00245 [Bdellovibrionales bacterium]
MAVRKLVWNAGFRCKLHDKLLLGTPNLAFKSKKKVIFVYGCFWHGHKCRRNAFPKSGFGKKKSKETKGVTSKFYEN